MSDFVPSATALSPPVSTSLPDAPQPNPAAAPTTTEATATDPTITTGDAADGAAAAEGPFTAGTVLLLQLTQVLFIIALVVFLLKWADAFFIPFLAGIFLSFVLGPVVDVLQRVRIPRPVGAALAICGFVAVIGGIGYAVWSQALDLADSLPTTITRVSRTLRQAQVDHNSSWNKITEAMRAVDSALQNPGNTPPPDAARRATAPAPVPVANADRGLPILVARQAAYVFGSLGTLGSVLLLAYFLLSAGDQFRRKTVALLGRRWHQRRNVVEMLDDIHSALQKYLGSLAVTNLILGFVTYGALRFLGFKGAAIWGTLAGILHAIPYLGPLITAGGVMVTGLQQWGSLQPALTAAGSTLIVATIIGTIAQTWILGRIANINHTAQFVSLLLFGWLWGAPGLLIAIPLTVTLKVVAEHVPPLHPLAEYLRD